MPPSRSRQPAIDITVALMRASLGVGSPGRLPADPPWEEVTAAASAGLVLPALASGARALRGGIASLGEAGGFFAAMEAANAARNERLMQRLCEAAGALDAAGIPAVALKGAVFALQDPARAPWRFLGDLDLLVPAERIDDAVAALTALSYDRGDVPDLGEELHHYPPLLHADGETVVELHTRLFPSAGNALLPPERLLQMADPASGFAGLAVPPAGDRMVHLIAHAQIANRRFARRTLSLRDALDFATLMRQAEIELAAVLARFEAEGYGPTAAGFMLAVNRVLGEPFVLPSSTRSDAQWAETAIASLAAPGGVGWRLGWQWFLEGAGRLLNREGRRRAWAGLRDPVRRRHFLQRRLFGWRNIR